MDKDRRSELLQEYFKVSDFVQAYDSYFVPIKAWSVTAGAVAVSAGFSKDLINPNAQAGIFLVAFALALSFWFTEVRFKLLQLAHTYRQFDLERACKKMLKSSRQEYLGLSGRVQRLIVRASAGENVLLWPHVMFPHVIFAALSIGLIILHVARAILGH